MDTRNIPGDFKVPPSGEILSAIFDRQKELAEKYIEIEGMPKPLWDLNSSEHQIWIKDFFWRVTEELCEALELYPEREDLEKGPLFYEEISDALHFLIEPMVMLGYTAVDVQSYFPFIQGKRLTLAGLLVYFESLKLSISFPQLVGSVIYQLGLAAGRLKNRKWKQTQMLTDVALFRKRLFNAFLEFLFLIAKMGMTPSDLYLVYMKKAEVNKFRQDTNY